MSSVLDLINQTNFKFSKKYGQNFLTDKNFLASIVNLAEITKDDEVLEIGTGAGTLTKEISRQAKKVVSYEIDTTLEPIIYENLKDIDNIKVIFKDIMQSSMQEIESNFSSKYKIVANLPYYITTPIIFKFLEETDNVESLTIMVQKEVADRIVCRQGSKDYGILSVMMDFYGDAKIVKKVSRTMFKPAPNVDSAVVRLDIKCKYDINKKLFSQVVRTSFANRRKTLVNNLFMKYGQDKERFEEILNQLHISPNTRAEQLSTEQFFALTNKLIELGIIK